MNIWLLNLHKKLLLIIYLIYTFQILCYDNVHFYRSPNSYFETRLDRQYLGTIDIGFGGGSTTQGFNGKKQKVPLLDIWGTHKMQHIGTGSIKDPLNKLDQILIALSQIKSDKTFATFSINGDFSFLETNIFYTQNFNNGLFIQAHLPIRSLDIDDIIFNDLSDFSYVTEEQKQIWTNFLTHFDAILERYFLQKRGPNGTTALGDLSTLIGWTYSYQNTTFFDFIDITLKIGLLTPTGKRKNEDRIFSLAYGYNGHWGFPATAAFTCGAYEWLTLGITLDTLIFLSKKATIRVKTDPQQEGLIILAKKQGSISGKEILMTSLYIKADHFARGLSCTFGYSFSKEWPTLFHSKDNRPIKTAIVYDGFSAHTLHILTEYDFTEQHWKVGPRIGVFYNHQISARHSFNTDNTQATFGIDIVLDY